ncbi:hypothetical protein BC567DRAFT_17482 [Phyllosticta citribraziliensis]
MFVLCERKVCVSTISPPQQQLNIQSPILSLFAHSPPTCLDPSQQLTSVVTSNRSLFSPLSPAHTCLQVASDLPSH